MRRISKGIIAALSGVLLAAGMPAMAKNDWQAGAGDDWKQALAAAKTEGKVVIAASPDLAAPMKKGFTRDTGIDIEFLTGSPRDLSMRVEREVRSGNITVDLVLSGSSHLPLVKEGFGVPIKPQLILPGVTDSKNWQDGAIKWVDDTQRYMPQGSEYVFAQPFLNRNIIKPGEITTWKDLLKPEYRGKIAAVDPRGPGQGQATAAYLAHVFGQDFVKQLYVDQKAVLSRDSRQAVEWMVRGVYPVVVGGSPTDLENFKSAGIDHVMVGDMEDGPGTTLGGFSVIWQPKGNPHPNAAKVFLNWYLSKPGQQAYIEGKGTPSRRTDIDHSDLPAYLKPKPGVSYVDGYVEDFYLNVRPKLQKMIVDALGGI